MFSTSHSSARMLPATLLAAALLALTACSQEKVETGPIIRPVKVIVFAHANDAHTLNYSGAVRARVEMNLGFRINGKISERSVDIGDRVKAGELLARIDPTDYGLAVQSARASLDAAERQVETTELARNRAEQLFAKNVSSKAQLEQATLSYDQAVASRDSARSALDQAKNQVNYTDLTSDQKGSQCRCRSGRRFGNASRHRRGRW